MIDFMAETSRKEPFAFPLKGFSMNVDSAYRYLLRPHDGIGEFGDTEATLLAFLLAFHRYNLWDMLEGWVISDEGHQLYQPLRWLSGQMFYRDFTTDNYPPGMITLHAALFGAFGVRMSVLRVFLAFVGAGIAAP